MAFLAALLAIGCAMIIARIAPEPLARRFDFTAALSGRAAPVVIGILTSLVAGYVWGHLHPTPVVHDEASYLLQARIFAHGAFSMPAPPLPEFFEQFHTYVTPAYASKYPPGHALLMAPGVLVGWPSLVPLLLDGIAGALVFMLARRIANPWVGLLTWTIWITAKSTLFPAASFFSQTTSTALWLAGWWILLEWRATRKRGWLVALSVCVAWMALTRPLTALAYATPVAVVVLVTVWRHRLWTDVAWAALAGAVVMMILPYANARTTGDWRVMPYSEYSKIYFPFDAPGFGVDSTPPRRERPHDMVQFDSAFKPVHAAYVPSAVGKAFVQRLARTAQGMWTGQRMVLALAALAAIPLVGVELGFAMVSVVVLLLYYLSYAHNPTWTVYYSETLPVFACLSALGLWRLLAGEANASRQGVRRPVAGAALAAAVLILVNVPGTLAQWQFWREGRRHSQEYQRNFFATVATVPDERAIVFVRYAPWHNLHISLIANDPDLASSRAWIVYDRGPDNERLLRLAPDRVPYLYDEERSLLIREQATAAR